MKDKVKGMGTFGVLLGTLLSRNIGNQNYFGLNGRIIIGLVCALLIVTCLIILIFKKFYLISFLILILSFPLVVGFIGIYYDNMNLLLGGLVAFFIILAIDLIIGRRYVKYNGDNIDYDKYRNKYRNQ